MKYIPLKQFIADESGSILTLVGLSLIFLFACAGIGYDLGRLDLVDQKMQQASDAAALAAASLPSAATTTDRQNEGMRYFALNYPSTYLGVTRPSPTVTPTSTTVTVTVPGTSMNTSFMGNVGITTMNASGKSVVDLNGSSSSDYDVVMVVDETGSTSQASSSNRSTRMDAMKAALTAMANKIVPVGNTNPNVRMGFMGYSSHITNKWGLSSNNANAITAISNLRPTCFNYDHVGMTAGLNMLNGGTAGIPNAQVDYPLLPYFGGEGLQFVDCTVDTNTAAPLPRTLRTNTSDANGLSKIKNVVFLTDGDIMTDPAPCADQFAGRLYPFYFYCYAGESYSRVDERNYPEFLASCNAIKAVAGTHIYVVNFASPPAGALATMQQCASTNATTGQPDFYYATDDATLLTDLTNITTTIQKERITQ